jgi:hypothetical protein
MSLEYKYGANTLDNKSMRIIVIGIVRLSSIYSPTTTRHTCLPNKNEQVRSIYAQDWR